MFCIDCGAKMEITTNRVSMKFDLLAGGVTVGTVTISRKANVRTCKRCGRTECGEKHPGSIFLDTENMHLEAAIIKEEKTDGMATI